MDGVSFRKRHGQWFAAAIGVVVLSLCACLFFGLAHPAVAHAATYEKDQVTWQVKKDKAYAKAEGKKLKGLQTIGDKTYYFDKKGVQRTGWRKIKGSYYYFNIANEDKGYMVTSKKVCGVKLTESGAAKLTKSSKAELNILLKANKLMDKLAKPAATKSVKLKAAWKYMTNRHKVAEREYRKFRNVKNWHHAFALDVFDRHGGSCYSMGAAFAYLAQAAGYKSCKAVSSGGHGWALIDGLVYDPEWTTWHQGEWFAIKGKKGTQNYAANSVYIATICSSKSASSSSSAGTSGKGSLVKKGKSWYCYVGGKKVKNTWKTIKGKRYYFKGNGKAVTGSYKVKGTYYVFNAKGQLLKGKKTREVTVGKNVYRVTKSGKAAKGWNSAKTQRFAKTGQLMCGVWVDGGKLYAADAYGNYNADLTAKLRAAAVLDASPAALLDLLGAPQKKTYVDSCQTGPSGLRGKDGIFEYKHVRVTTFLDASGDEFLMSVESA